MTSSLRKALCLALVLPCLSVAVLVGAGPAQATPDHYTPTRGATFRPRNRVRMATIQTIL